MCIIYIGLSFFFLLPNKKKHCDGPLVNKENIQDYLSIFFLPTFFRFHLAIARHGVFKKKHEK